MYAAENNHIECAKELLEEAGMQNDDGNTALMIAIHRNNLKLIEELAPLEKHISNRNK